VRVATLRIEMVARRYASPFAPETARASPSETLIRPPHREQHRSFAPLSNGDARAMIRVISMHAVMGYRRRSILALTILLLGVFFTVPSAASHAGATAAGRAQRFLLVSDNPSDNAKPIILGFGPVHAKGIDRQVTNHKDLFVFPNGKLVVRHVVVAHHRRHDPATCLFTFRQRGTYKITDGSGDYANARGHGHFHLKGTFVACGHQGPPDYFSLTIEASGSIRL
jgi:hypothetical protein